MSQIKVISQQPPAGRCTLYARYADAISDVLGWNHRVVHSECRDPHGEGFPTLLVKENAIQPSDGAILSPEDICTHLAQIGIGDTLIAGLQSRLEIILEDFLEKWTP